MMRLRRLRRHGVLGRCLVIIGLLASGAACDFGESQRVVVAPRTTVTQPAGGANGWRAVQPPDAPNPNLGRFSDLAVFSDDSALAVGTSYVGGAGQCAAPALEAWDGATWRPFPHPLPTLPAGTCGGEVRAMSGTSLDDIWLITTTVTANTAVYHWNGSRWIGIGGTGLPRRTYLVDLSVTADRIVAVGYREQKAMGQLTVLATRDRGRRVSWSVNPTIERGRLVAVSASSNDNIYAVGEPHHRRRSVIVFHWDGTQWRLLNAPKTLKAAIADVATSGPGDVLIVGDVTGQATIAPGSGVPEAIHLHDGTWTKPQVPVVNGFLTSVAATGPDTYWAAGIDQSEPTMSSYFQLSDDDWLAAPGPQRTTVGSTDNQYVEINALAVVPGTSSVFGVGYTATTECEASNGCGRAIAGRFAIDKYGE